MVEIGTFHISGSSLTDGEEFFDGSFTSAALEALVTFP
jgi:hypothetical protein